MAFTRLNINTNTYYGQIQMGMALLNLKKTDFVSYASHDKSIEEYRAKTRNVLFSRILSDNFIWWEKLRTIDCGVYSREKTKCQCIITFLNNRYREIRRNVSALPDKNKECQRYRMCCRQ
jgi:hypothetical protein